MMTVTFDEFDIKTQRLEEFVKENQINLSGYWPTKDEFDYAVTMFSNNIFFYVLLSYIIENNKEYEDATISKKELNTFLINNLEFIE